jgi:hypothetical protein
VKAVLRRTVAAPDKRVAALWRFALSITAFTVVGHLWLGIEPSWAQTFTALATAYVLELGLEVLDARATRRPLRFRGGPWAFAAFMLPSHITALSVGLLIYPSDLLWPFAFATAAGVAAKYVFRAVVGGKARHFMNPSNLGIALTFVLFPWVGIAPPYHFTEWTSGALDWIIPAFVLVSGLALNLMLTGKGPVIAAWLLAFAGQAVARSLLQDVSLLGALAPMTGTAFVLYTNYMITDPGTTPVSARNQAVFGVLVGVAYGVITAFHVVYGMFFGLVAVCALRGLLLYGLGWRERQRAPRAERRPVAEPLPGGVAARIVSRRGPPV